MRDSSFIVYALMRIGFVDEAARYIDFLTSRCLDVAAGKSLRVVYRIDGSTDLKEEILDHLEGYRGSRPVRLGNDAARLQGRMVTMAGEAVQLSERERDLLAALARRPGAVLSKAELLRIVWPEGDADEHAVEVAVARLRRRLGPNGHLLETVFRLGYRLAS